ncbi:hypothetical protein B0H13DRAFT_2670066 [Mycena leptocephala]|nr:hypothetical protein B0H13DRAFT_2670066 [Mycena leptocephala]
MRGIMRQDTYPRYQTKPWNARIDASPSGIESESANTHIMADPATEPSDDRMQLALRGDRAVQPQLQPLKTRFRDLFQRFCPWMIRQISHRLRDSRATDLSSVKSRASYNLVLIRMPRHYFAVTSPRSRALQSLWQSSTTLDSAAPTCPHLLRSQNHRLVPARWRKASAPKRMIALGGRSGIVELHDEEECEYWIKMRPTESTGSGTFVEAPLFQLILGPRFHDIVRPLKRHGACCRIRNAYLHPTSSPRICPAAPPPGRRLVFVLVEEDAQIKSVAATQSTASSVASLPAHGIQSGENPIHRERLRRARPLPHLDPASVVPDPSNLRRITLGGRVAQRYPTDVTTLSSPFHLLRLVLSHPPPVRSHSPIFFGAVGRCAGTGGALTSRMYVPTHAPRSPTAVDGGDRRCGLDLSVAAGEGEAWAHDSIPLIFARLANSGGYARSICASHRSPLPRSRTRTCTSRYQTARRPMIYRSKRPRVPSLDLNLPRRDEAPWWGGNVPRESGERGRDFLMDAGSSGWDL